MCGGWWLSDVLLKSVMIMLSVRAVVLVKGGLTVCCGFDCRMVPPGVSTHSS